MKSDITDRQVAEWMCIGFVRCWTWQNVAVALGCGISDNQDFELLHSIAPFTPQNRHFWRKPVRAFVRDEWPRLYAYMLKNEGNANKLLDIVDQVCKLKSRDVRGRRLSDSDIEEGRKNRAEAKMTTTANRAARNQQLSTQRGAWNVCK